MLIACSGAMRPIPDAALPPLRLRASSPISTPASLWNPSGPSGNLDYFLFGKPHT
jgi:hypothetical protein